jgi:hypothetical protein
MLGFLMPLLSKASHPSLQLRNFDHWLCELEFFLYTLKSFFKTGFLKMFSGLN